MKPRPVIRRVQADTDIREAVAYYLSEGAGPVALRFIDALEQVFLHLSRHPAAGSPHFALELDLPGLRHWPVKRFPWLVFYIETETHVEVWRILHSARDIPESLQLP